ncbi:hypothetical protein Sjap_006490 [Stephania japonica]|uniref:F-box domain-containing protein n=1 Tax=Stephania japonica TaxID=461633 RepID=A0AAP0PJS9_9MAGN
MFTFWIRKQDSNVADLPEDLVRKHILSRLPAKSLFIFKSVCKKWHNWISTDRLFAVLLYSNSNKGFLLQDDGEMSTTENPDHCFKLEEDLLVGGSTHGLLYGRCRGSNKDEILICNPITKHKAFVPNPNRRCNIALAVDAHPYYPNNGFVVIAALDSTTLMVWIPIALNSKCTRPRKTSGAQPMQKFKYHLQMTQIRMRIWMRMRIPMKSPKDHLRMLF